jgi:cell wall assembly regulator SMI1
VADAEWVAALRFADGYRLEHAAQATDIAELESALGVTIPDALRALYLTSDGVFGDPGQWYVIWPLAWVRARNQQSWESSSGHGDELLAFGDDGTI